MPAPSTGVVSSQNQTHPWNYKHRALALLAIKTSHILRTAGAVHWLRWPSQDQQHTLNCNSRAQASLASSRSTTPSDCKHRALTSPANSRQVNPWNRKTCALSSGKPCAPTRSVNCKHLAVALLALQDQPHLLNCKHVCWCHWPSRPVTSLELPTLCTGFAGNLKTSNTI